MDEKSVPRIHRSFWVIAVVGLMFNLMGCANFFSQMSADRVASMPENVRAIVEGRPAWATAAFANAVFGGAVGGILLVLKKSAAYFAFIASVAGAVAAQIPLLRMSDLPPGFLVGGLSQIVVGGFLVGYTKWAERKGWVG